ncbi:hypothetical protein D3C86_1956380 [compost metagenome]
MDVVVYDPDLVLSFKKRAAFILLKRVQQLEWRSGHDLSRFEIGNENFYALENLRTDGFQLFLRYL